MNRAILIVICDFLVSSMLAMMTGMVPADSARPGVGAAVKSQAPGAPGLGLDAAAAATLLAQLRENEARIVALRARLLAEQTQKGLSGEREAELNKLTRQLAEAKVRSEHLERMLTLARNRTGRLTPAELAAQRDEAMTDAKMTSIRLDDAREQLAVIKSERDAALHQATDSTAKHASSEALYRTTAARLAAVEAELKKQEARLSETRETLAARQDALARTRKELADAMTRTGVLHEQSKKYEHDLSFLRGRLSSAERDLAETRSQNELIRRQAETRELERNDAQRQLADLQRTLKNTVGELSKARRELTLKGEQLAVTSQKLRTAEQKLSSDVQVRYAESTVRLDVQISEWRLMVDQKGASSFYLPLVEAGGKTVLPASFRNFSGDDQVPINFIGITSLKLTLFNADPKGSKAGQPITTPLLAGAAGEGAFFALEVEPKGLGKPLKALTASELKKRGVQDLYLFKRTSYGKQSASLGSRCSIDFSSRGSYLYIRNVGRSASELKAEPGDFVLTREGEYVGTVVELESRSVERYQEARCFIFPDQFSWQGAQQVPVTKKQGARYFEDFAKAMRRVQQMSRDRKQ